MTGATPIFAEVERDYWCVDVEDIERRITPRTKAVIGVHLFGQCYDPLLINLCKRHNIALIEDAAQAHGGSILVAGRKQMVGALGTVSCFSFFPSKNVAVGGEGGMITSANSEIGLRIRSIVDHGRDGSLQSQEVGTNMRMSEVFAAIGRKQLEHLDLWLKRRRMNAERFTVTIANNQLLEAPLVRKDTQHAWHQYCVKTDTVEEFESFILLPVISTQCTQTILSQTIRLLQQMPFHHLLWQFLYITNLRKKNWSVSYKHSNLIVD
jgi:perosamine synthetase